MEWRATTNRGGGASHPHPGADWSSDVQGICPVGRSVLGPFGALEMHQNVLECPLGPKYAPKRHEMPLGAIKMHQNALKLPLWRIARRPAVAGGRVIRQRGDFGGILGRFGAFLWPQKAF